MGLRTAKALIILGCVLGVTGIVSPKWRPPQEGILGCVLGVTGITPPPLTACIVIGALGFM